MCLKYVSYNRNHLQNTNFAILTAFTCNTFPTIAKNKWNLFYKASTKYPCMIHTFIILYAAVHECMVVARIDTKKGCFVHESEITAMPLQFLNTCNQCLYNDEFGQYHGYHLLSLVNVDIWFSIICWSRAIRRCIFNC